ncbi:hydroxyisourate hydrolase [Marinobacterium jannaschii]|uniref:hydroxyisourate hydrolase n=1 Tax=Marinobacterium jannaschii TaxID=64970 RepID=UPI00048A2E82|nr:hydroxyisourate hydrolase [Marinobacterium jannaschii]
MGYLTTHVLDSAHGVPGNEIEIRLYQIGEQRSLLKTVTTNDDGRVDAPLLEKDEFRKGVYELQFAVSDYYRRLGVELPEPAFLGDVVIRFGIADEAEHYHVPLLISPYSYSTYRGS